MHRLRLLLCAFLPLMLACRDTTGPRLRQLTLNVCQPWHWVAFQNDDGPWTHLGPGAATYPIEVTPRVTVAYARFQSSPPAVRMQIDYLHADQLEAMAACGAGPQLPGGTISGSVAGLSAGQWSVVTYNGIGAYVSASSTTWHMPAQPVPATLVAARYDSGFSEVHANRIITRRDRSYLSGTTVPLLDFESDEAFTPQQNTVSFTGPRAWVGTAVFISGNGHGLSNSSAMPSTEGHAARSAAFHSIPVARLADGDMHLMTISSADFSLTPSDFRTMQHYYRTGADHTMSVGPALLVPTFSTVATEPYRRVRVELPLQLEYSGSVSIDMAQCCSTHSFRATIRLTREYFGYPAVGAASFPPDWSVTLPDFTTVPGFDPAGMLREGEFSWFVSATSAPFGFRHADAKDGDIMRYASRRGSSP